LLIAVARLEPVTSRLGDDPDGRLARLIRDGSIRQGRAAAPRALFIDQPPLPKPGSSAVEALLEERREGR